MNRFECAKVLGTRACEIEQGALSTIDVPPEVTDALQIAYLELQAGKLPIKATTVPYDHLFTFSSQPLRKTKKVVRAIAKTHTAKPQ